MRAILLLILAVVLVGGGLKLAGVPLPFVDYAVGPIGGDHAPGMPDIRIEAPGFDEADSLP
jgi:hypothetical protein